MHIHSHIHLAMLISDWLIWGLFFCAVVCCFYMRSQPHLREPWQHVLHRRLSMVAFVILITFTAVGLLDSIHLQVTKTDINTMQTGVEVKTALDLIASPLGEQDEKTYSAPFAISLYNKASTAENLKYAGAHLANIDDHKVDIAWRVINGFLIGCISYLIFAGLFVWWLADREQKHVDTYLSEIFSGKTRIAWREALLTMGFIWISTSIIVQLATHYHILGTDKIGSDVFYDAIHSIRTGLLIGTLATISTLPFALILGTMAGYFGGKIDDVIQYLYTTLSSIPGVLLISATILVMQVYITNHTNLFPTLLERADARLLALCFILGITGWAGLCRLLRGETMKLRQLEYVQAAQALGASHFRIIMRHIIPNVMHIVLITLVLDFSGLVLAEAVLSYVGVGVDPTTISWGNMINSSRLELAREPMVWWPLLAALIFMFLLVLSANLFSDAVRDAFDPRLRNTL